MMNEQHVLRNQCIKKRRAGSVLIWLVEVRLRVRQNVTRQLWRWVGAMLLLVGVPFHGQNYRLVVFSVVLVNWATMPSQPPPLHAAALTNASVKHQAWSPPSPIIPSLSPPIPSLSLPIPSLSLPIPPPPPIIPSP